MPTERIAMRRVREMLRLSLDGGLAIREVARRMGVARLDAAGDVPALRAIGPGLAAAAGPDGHRSGGAALRRGRDQAGPSPAAGAGLGGAEPRAEAQARHAADPVGRVHRGQPGRLPLQPLLRPLPGLGSAPAGDHAPDPPGRRQAVRRLCRRHGAGDRRPPHRQDAGGASVRGGDGRIEPQLRLRHAGPRRCPTGSTPTSRPSPTSAARPGCWCRTTPRSR